MNSADLYQRANSVQRNDAKAILDELSNAIQWRPDGQDTLLDIGCGSGDVTIDFILPILPNSFKKLVGSDISEEMLRHARLQYENSRIKFIQMDIGGNLNDFEERFDHITSFYCLHWVQNKKKVVKNIYDLLNPEGDCLLVFLANNPIFDAYKQLSSMMKWSSYMKDVNKYISPYQYSKDPEAEFSDLLYSSGFSEYSVEARDKVFIYEGLETLRNNVKAVNPFTERMPKNLQEEFLDDYLMTVTKMNLSEKMHNKNDFRFITPYKLMVVYARK